MNRWDTLTMGEKNQLLGIYASKGYNNLANIIAHYNSFAEGGNVDGEGDDIDNRTGKPRYRRDIHNVNITSSSENDIEGAARDTSTIGPLAFYPPKYYIGRQGNQFAENPNVTYDSWFDEHPEMIDVMTDIVGRYNNRLNNRGQQLPQLNRYYFEKLYNPEDDPIIHEAINRMLQAKWNRDVRTYNDNRTLNLWDTVEKFPAANVRVNNEYQRGGKINLDLTVPGTTPETSSSTYVRPRLMTDVDIDRQQGLPKGTTTMRRYAEQELPIIKQNTITREQQDIINNAAKKQKALNNASKVLDVVENLPVIGDAVTVGRTGADVVGGDYTSASLIPLMFLFNKIPFGKKALKKSTDYYPEIKKYLDLNIDKINAEYELGHVFDQSEVDNTLAYFRNKHNINLTRKEASDLLTARRLDLLTLAKSLNENQRLGIIRKPDSWDTSINLFNNSGHEIGHLAAHKQPNESKYYIAGIANTSERYGNREHKVGRDLYDMLLDVTGTPFITGQDLMNPKATMKTIMNDGYTRITRPDLKAFWFEDIGVEPFASEVIAHDIRHNNNVAKSLLFDPSILKEGKMNIDLKGGLYKSNGGQLGHITPYGQWQYPHQVTTIPSNNITMQGVSYPVVGISNTGDVKYMLPNMDYLFNGQYVTEYPIK